MICENCREDIKKDKTKNSNLKGIEWVHSFLNYKNKNFKDVLFSIKYHYVKSATKYLSLILYLDFYEFIKEKLLICDKKDLIIIPIPISKKRLIERDYNQTEILIKDTTKEIKNNLKLDLENNIYIDLLIKNKHTIKFAETHSSTEREDLIKNAFIVREPISSLLFINSKKSLEEFLENKTIILFDDITTTGSTFYEARNTLVKAGAKKENIFGYAIAH